MPNKRPNLIFININGQEKAVHLTNSELKKYKLIEKNGNSDKNVKKRIAFLRKIWKTKPQSR